MGTRPSTYKGGGGLLDGVSVTIVDYAILKNTYEIKQGPDKGGTFTPIKLLLSLLPDGADQPVQRPLRMSSKGEAFGEVTDDGKVLQNPDGADIAPNSEVGAFITSLCMPANGDGFPEERFSDDESIVDYRPMIGTRVRLSNKVDEEKTKRFGKEKSKEGKEYDRRQLLVEEVLEVPKVGTSVPKGGTKSASSGTSKKANGSAGGPVNAEEIVAGYLADAKDNTLHRNKLRMKVLTDARFKADRETRDSLAGLVTSDDWLQALDGDSGLAYDPGSGNVSIAVG